MGHRTYRGFDLIRTLVALCVLLSACVAEPGSPTGSSSASTPPPAPTSIPEVDSGGPIRLELVADGIARPTGMAQAADGRIFVTQQDGQVRTVRDGVVDPQPFLDLSDRVAMEGESGLLSIALHPDFESSGRYFAVYGNSDADTELREFNVADGPDAEGALLLAIPKETTFHYGGSMLFGPDGYLYLSIGDDGRQGNDRADPDSLYGTVVRLDVDTTPGSYEIPPDNPFARGGGRPEVIAYGFRNPWRISMDAATGDIYVGDVGQNTAEEVNVVPSETGEALDFGWSATEGYECRDPECDQDGITWPIVAYDHEQGDCGVIGGYVMPAEQPLPGRYLYGDLCTGRIWSVDPGEKEPEPSLELESGLRFSSFGVGNDGTVYVLVHYTNGSIYRIAD